MLVALFRGVGSVGGLLWVARGGDDGDARVKRGLIKQLFSFVIMASTTNILFVFYSFASSWSVSFVRVNKRGFKCSFNSFYSVKFGNK